jgi:DNA polymerase III epsilon subunit-like protein
MKGLVEKFDLYCVCDYFAVDRTKRTYHGALIDVELTAQVFLKMIDARYTQE